MKKDIIVNYFKRVIKYFLAIVIINYSFQLIKYKGIGMLIELEEVNFMNILLTIVGLVGVIGGLVFTIRDMTLWSEEKKQNKKEKQNHDY